MGQPATRARRVRISPSLLTWALTTALIGAALGLHAVIQSRAANGGLLDNAVGAVVLVALFAMSEVLVIHVRLGHRNGYSASVPTVSRRDVLGLCSAGCSRRLQNTLHMAD